MTRFEEYNGYFNKIRQLCIDAYKSDIITDEKYFIDNGIPEDFLMKCKKGHLIAGGKGKQNLFVNWHQNKKYPQATVDNFLEYLRTKGEE